MHWGASRSCPCFLNAVSIRDSSRSLKAMEERMDKLTFMRDEICKLKATYDAHQELDER